MTLRNHRMAIAMTRAALVACIVIVAACAPAVSSPVAVENAKQIEAAAPVPRMSFIVNFGPSHALGQAQALQSAGRHDEAERLVGITLRDNAALRGLCFERFTLGGAEIVLNVCAPSAWEDVLITQERWLEQLGATPGVAYVERNLVAQHEHAAEAGRS